MRDDYMYVFTHAIRSKSSTFNTQLTTRVGFAQPASQGRGLLAGPSEVRLGPSAGQLAVGVWVPT
eukprot:5030142-Pleurochrysis_carterae.AAC.2